MHKNNIRAETRRFITVLAILCASALPAVALDEVTLQLKWHHQFQFAGYYAAIENGYYEAEGLSVNLREGEGVDTIKEVLEGRADFGIAMSDLVVQYAQGKPVVALAAIFQHSPLVFAFRSELEGASIQDLNHATVMIEEHAAELFAYLAAARVSPTNLVIKPYHDAVNALIDGQVDAISAYITDEPYLLDHIDLPIHLLSPRSAGIDFYGDTLFTSRERLNNNPELTRRFIRATRKGWEYAINHPDEIIDLILSRYSQAQSREMLAYEAFQTERLIRPDLVEIGYMNPGRWQHIAGIYADLDMTRRNLNLKPFLYREQSAAKTWRDFLILLLLVIAASGAVAFALHYRKLHGRLADSQRKLQTLMDSLPGMAYRCENIQSVWPMEFISKGCETLTGYQEAELITGGDIEFGDLILPEDRDLVDQSIEEGVRNHKPFQVNYRIRKKDGKIRWVWEQGLAVDHAGGKQMLEGLILDINEQVLAVEEREKAFQKLQNVLQEIKTLRGILPICSSCKRIRDDTGAWEQLEVYIHDHSDANFSHGLCPDCEEKAHQELDQRFGKR